MRRSARPSYERSPWWPGRSPDWVAMSHGPKRWNVDRRPLHHHHGRRTRPYAVCYAVELQRRQWVTCTPRCEVVDCADPAFYVFGVGRAGCRTAKRVARRLAHDSTFVHELPADAVVPPGGRCEPGRPWWVAHHPAW